MKILYIWKICVTQRTKFQDDQRTVLLKNKTQGRPRTVTSLGMTSSVLWTQTAQCNSSPRDFHSLSFGVVSNENDHMTWKGPHSFLINHLSEHGWHVFRDWKQTTQHQELAAVDRRVQTCSLDSQGRNVIKKTSSLLKECMFWEAYFS